MHDKTKQRFLPIFRSSLNISKYELKLLFILFIGNNLNFYYFKFLIKCNLKKSLYFEMLLTVLKFCLFRRYDVFLCRDFAYVARDRATRKHMCHVFRCEAPARTIANALRDICKRIMIERSLQPPPRPTDLPSTRRPRPLSGN